jgi:hypothetical protein
VKIRKETVAVDAAEPGFVHVIHQQIYEDLDENMGGDIWFERANLRWVIDTLGACLTTYAFPETELHHGQDNLKVFESGPEQQPFVNLFNTRPKDAPHGGVTANNFSKPIARQLLDQLIALG